MQKGEEERVDTARHHSFAEDVDDLAAEVCPKEPIDPKKPIKMATRHIADADYCF